MIGILTEKPSQARNFAKALGGMTGTYNGEKYQITHARGHLYEFVDPDKQVSEDKEERYKKWDVKELPWNEKDLAWKYRAAKDSSSILADIRNCLSKCDEVVIATDDDPTGEGELLAWEILDQNKLTKGKKVSRMYFADESEKEIQKAFKNRKSIASMDTDADYRKALFRAKWDFLSMQFTRIAYSCSGEVLRQGRLKSAMVKLVGDQLALVSSYKKIPYYQNRFKDENENVYTNPDEPTFKTKEEVPQQYHESDVIVDGTERKHTAPPKLIDLASLASRLAPSGLKTKKVLEIYQAMYEAQILSYPRTEDKFITPEQFNDLLPHADAIAEVVGVKPELLTHKEPRKTHVKTGCAHGANRPGPKVPSSLEELDSKFGKGAGMIYKIVARCYLAMLCDDYIYDCEKGHLKDYPNFTGSSNIPVSLGWRSVYNVDSNDDLKAKHLGKTAQPFIFEGFPKKPSAPTMKWLMKQLEKYDVGTGATRASIYADVTSDKSKYPLLVDEKGKLSMTSFGETSYKLLPDTHIGDLKITEHVMAQMRDIADEKLNPDDALHEMQSFVTDDIKTMTDNSIKSGIEKKHYAQKEKYTGTWKGKTVSFSREWGGYKFSDEECEKLCNGEDIVLSLVSAKTKKPYKIHGSLEEYTYNGHKIIGFKNAGFVQDSNSYVETDYVCPICGKPILETEKAWQCAGHDYKNKKSCQFVVWKTIAGRKLTKENAEELITTKRLHSLSYKSKSGKTFDAELAVGKKGDLQFVFDNTTSGTKTDMVCPVCGSQIIETEKAWMCKNYSKDKNGACGFIIWKNIAGYTMSEQDLRILLAASRLENKNFKSKSGKPFTADLVMADDGKLSFEFKNAPKTKTSYLCPKCGRPVIDDGRKLSCSGNNDGSCDFVLWKTICGHKLTKDDMDHLFNNEETDYCKMKSKSGKEFEACMYFDEDSKVKLQFDTTGK